MIFLSGLQNRSSRKELSFLLLLNAVAFYNKQSYSTSLMCWLVCVPNNTHFIYPFGLKYDRDITSFYTKQFYKIK